MMKISKRILLILVICMLFTLQVAGASTLDYGIVRYTGTDYYSVSELDKDRDVRNFNSNTQIVLEFTLMFMGSYQSVVTDELQKVIDGKTTINDVIVFGDGLWYDSLELLSVSPSNTNTYTWASVYDDNGSYRYVSNRLLTDAKFRLTYVQPSGVPSVLVVDSSSGIQNVMTVKKTNFNISLPWLETSTPFSCYYQVDSVVCSGPVGQRKYIPGGSNTYNVYFMDTFIQPFALAVDKYNQDSAGDYPSKMPEESVSYTFDVVGDNVNYADEYVYSFDGGYNHGKIPLFGRAQFGSLNSEFSITNVKFVPEKSYLDGYPLYLELRCSKDGSSSTRIQNVYNPSAFCFTSFRYANSVTITNDSNTTQDYDVSQLYTDMTFNIPEWDSDAGFGKNLGMFFTGIIEATLSLIGSALYNAAIWIFCETPVLSTLTKPLFLLIVRTGGIFTKIFLPVITALGVLTPVVCVLLVLKSVKKYSGV